MLRRREALACPDVRGLLALVEQVTGAPRGAQNRLADLVGVKHTTISKWAKGAPVPHVYVAKLVEVETKLKARVETPKAAPVTRPLPLMANVVDVRVEGEQALLRFALKVPGEETAREVVAVLVPRGLLASLTSPT